MIPLNDLSRQVTPEEEEAVGRVVASGWYLNGPETHRLESAFSAYVGVGHALGVASGTDALTLSLAALGVGPRSVVATVANAGSYSTVACRRLGAKVVYVDVDADTACMDPVSLQKCLESVPVDAIVVTHLYGQLAEMSAIVSLARIHEVSLIEDCAHAPGAQSRGVGAGSFGDIAAFSFYPSKNLGAFGDAGMLVGNNAVAMDRARKLAQYGWDERFVIRHDNGLNSRLDEIQAAVLNLRLEHLDRRNQQRRNILTQYQQSLSESDSELHLFFTNDETNVAHLAVVECTDRDALARHLAQHGVETAVHYPVPDHHQPAWNHTTPISLPTTERLSRQVLTVPCFPEMSTGETAAVASALTSF